MDKMDQTLPDKDSNIPNILREFEQGSRESNAQGNALLAMTGFLDSIRSFLDHRLDLTELQRCEIMAGIEALTYSSLAPKNPMEVP
jgi:hypothetical protein